MNLYMLNSMYRCSWTTSIIRILNQVHFVFDFCLMNICSIIIILTKLLITLKFGNILTYYYSFFLLVMRLVHFLLYKVR
jgi:hypothetical protein